MPDDWTVIRGKAPLLATISSGRAVVALWRYRRRGRLPHTHAQLGRARTALLAAIRGLQPSIEVISSKLLKLDRRPAIEVQALERIDGALRRVRSTHVYGSHVEVVIDAYSPPGVFARVEAQVFVPVRRSLRIARK